MEPASVMLFVCDNGTHVCTLLQGHYK